jgi:hypothetical protein
VIDNVTVEKSEEKKRTTAILERKVWLLVLSVVCTGELQIVPARTNVKVSC